MYVVCMECMNVFFCRSWTQSLGTVAHVTFNLSGVKGHHLGVIWVIDLLVKVFGKQSLYAHTYVFS